MVLSLTGLMVSTAADTSAPVPVMTKPKAHAVTRELLGLLDGKGMAA